MSDEVTVIIAAKDAEKWLPQTLQSLLSQTHDNWQCIVSVNGSSDSTQEIAESTGDSRFKVTVSGIANKSCAVNRAIIACSTPLVCILDADDLWRPNKLETQMSAMKELRLSVLGTQMAYIDELGNKVGPAPTLPLQNDECYRWLMSRNNPIANSSVMYRREIHDLIGYYDPEKFAVEDYDMWMRCMRAGLRMGNCEDKMLLHRIHSSSNFNSSNRQQSMKRLVDEINTFHSHLYE